MPHGCTAHSAPGAPAAGPLHPQIYGPESSGKTTLALHAIAEVQKAGGIACFVDAEHAFDPEYAEVRGGVTWVPLAPGLPCLRLPFLARRRPCRQPPPPPGAPQRLGINVSELYVSQPDCGETALQIVDELARSQAVQIIAIDSVSALVPRSEIDGEIGALQVGRRGLGLLGSGEGRRVRECGAGISRVLGGAAGGRRLPRHRVPGACPRGAAAAGADTAAAAAAAAPARRWARRRG